MQRRLTAILSADVAGYSRLMGDDEEGTLARFKLHRRELVDVTIAKHSGRVVKNLGDGMLIEFASIVDGVRCALAIQRGMAERNATVPQAKRMEFRIGAHVGDIVIEDGDIFGDGVNIATRVQSIAEPGSVCISDDAYRQLRGKLDAAFEDKGNQHLKNIASPVRVYSIRPGALADAVFPVRTHLELPDKPSLVVLPFENMSAEPGQEYLADGIVEAITAALSSIRAFFVIARNSAYTYKGRSINVRDIGRELGVAYLIEGSVQKAGNRLRITVQLVETESGAHVWSSRYEGAVDDIFDLQDRITEQLAGAIQPSIRIAEAERSRRKPPQNMGSYDYTMRAMPHVWALDRDENAKALELLDSALLIDPAYPLALSLAGWCHAQRAVYNWVEDRVESRERARSFAERAADLSGDDATILAVLGAVHNLIRNHGTARSLLERAVTLDPNAAWAWSRLGYLKVYTDRPQEALVDFEHAIRLSPLDPLNFNNYAGLGMAYFQLGQYDIALTYSQRALEEHPKSKWINQIIAVALSAAGRMEEAQKAWMEMMRYAPGDTAAKFKERAPYSPATSDRYLVECKKLGLPD